MSEKRRIVSAVSWQRPGDRRVQALGGKAVGLLDLPMDWTPPFVVLGQPFLEAWQEAGGSAARAFAGATHEDTAALADLLRKAKSIEGSQGLIARSNAPGETDGEARGRFRSHDTSLQEVEVFATVDAVLEQSRPQEPVFAVVQVRMARRSAGYLSNERRVAERSSQWLIEENQAGGGRRRIRVRGEPLSLDVGDRGTLETALRRLAGELREHSDGRVHCEWVWDGRRLWVVQRESAHEIRGGPVADYLSISPGDNRGAEPAGGLRRIRRLSRAEAAGWSKLQRRYAMEQLGLPVAPVYFLPGSVFEEQQASGFAELREDLATLTRAGTPLVVRCDVTSESNHQTLALPTSDPLASSDALLEAMRGTAAALAGRGIGTGEWAFLPASLVPARASVMAQARPGTQMVRLDALWGFPDGVGGLPHDSYFHRPGSGRTESRREYKGACLLWNEVDGWHFEAVPAPYDWAAVLNEEEVATVAEWALRLADHLDREVQLMVLARVGGRRGAAGLVPWHYTDHIVPVRRQTVQFAPGGEVAVVREPADLASLDLVASEGIFLRPVAAELRDPAFVQEVGRRAATADLPVYFEGSVLGHSFYLLRSTGAHVTSIGAAAPIVRPEDYNKLVRDRIPEIVSAAGGGTRVVHANDAQARWLLRQKLVEEALEVFASDGDELVEELADLAEVLEALYRRLGVDAGNVEAAQRRKRAERGGFEELVFLESTVPDASMEEQREADEEALFNLAEEPTRQGQALGSADPVEVLDENSRVMFRIPMVPPLRQGLPLREQRLTVGAASVWVGFDDGFVELRVERGEPQPAQLELELDE